MPRSRADIANTATRIFLQEFGATYDEMRGLPQYVKATHFEEVKEFFGNTCCYCGTELVAGHVDQDHLIPLNRTELGLHAWGNIVPSCSPCNSVKRGRLWQDIVQEKAGLLAPERIKRIKSFCRALWLCASIRPPGSNGRSLRGGRERRHGSDPNQDRADQGGGLTRYRVSPSRTTSRRSLLLDLTAPGGSVSTGWNEEDLTPLSSLTVCEPPPARPRRGGSCSSGRSQGS